jgi:hypothetical protein
MIQNQKKSLACGDEMIFAYNRYSAKDHDVQSSYAEGVILAAISSQSFPKQQFALSYYLNFRTTFHMKKKVKIENEEETIIVVVLTGNRESASSGNYRLGRTGNLPGKRKNLHRLALRFEEKEKGCRIEGQRVARKNPCRELKEGVLVQQ